MQPLLFFVMFLMLMSAVGSYVYDNTSSSQQLTQERIAAMQEYFRNVESVVNNDITPTYWRGNPLGVSTPADYIHDTPQLRQLSPGTFSDSAADQWGSPIVGKIITSPLVIYNDATAGVQALAPVTGFLFISPGPDRTVQTDYSAVNSLSALQGVAAPSGSDDIVYTFTDEDAQRRTFNRMQAAVQRVGAAEQQYFEDGLNTYHKAKMAEYADQLDAGTAPTLASMMSVDDPHDPDYPKFADISKDADRKALGVDGDIGDLTKTLPTMATPGATSNAGGGSLKLTGIQSGPDYTLKIANSSSATPWSSNGGVAGTLYTLTVHAQGGY